MTLLRFDLLVAAGFCSLLAAALHVAVIIGGPGWYRFFGAGEAMARMAEQRMLTPSLITLGIAAMLAIWGVYALSGAGVMPRLPLLKLVLPVITGIYLLRGLVGLFAPFLHDHAVFAQNSVTFWVWSSVVCLAIGLVHLLGLIGAWSEL